MNQTAVETSGAPAYLRSCYSTQSCMESCTQCHQTLMHTAMQYCLPHGGKHLAPELFRLMINCAELCQTTANFQLSDSQFCRQLSLLNAEACEECASRCEQLSDLDDCVQACRQCAECCRRMHELPF